MTALLSPVARQLFLNPSDGTPASGFLLFTYLAGTTTKADTFVDADSGTPNTNPIILDALGECDIWLTSGVGYKYVFAYPTDTDPPTNPIWTVDNIFGSSLTAPISPWAIASGASDAITATYSPPNTSLPDGLLLGFRALAANATTTPTFTPDSQPTYAITDDGGMPLALGAIAGADYECLVRFNAPHTRWELLNPAAGAATGLAQLGPAINASMTVASASSTGTFNADFLTVVTSLGGTTYALASYSQSINLAVTGPGGMDTGSAPAIGYVALYAIYNPTSALASILACNVTTSSGTVYSGANMPAGYTASALIGIWPTNSSSQFVLGSLSGRRIFTAPVTVALGSGTSTISIAAAIPPAAKSIFSYFQASVGVTTSLQIAANASNIGGYILTSSDTGAQNPLGEIPIVTPQSIWKSSTNGGSLHIGGYTF